MQDLTRSQQIRSGRDAQTWLVVLAREFGCPVAQLARTLGPRDLAVEIARLIEAHAWQLARDHIRDGTEPDADAVGSVAETVRRIYTHLRRVTLAEEEARNARAFAQAKAADSFARRKAEAQARKQAQEGL